MHSRYDFDQSWKTGYGIHRFPVVERTHIPLILMGRNVWPNLGCTMVPHGAYDVSLYNVLLHVDWPKAGEATQNEKALQF